MQHTTIAVDVAKSVFEVAVSQRPGRVSERHRLSRRRFARFLAEQAPATVVMEACGMAHYWGLEARARGHTVRLLPPRDVRPYVRGNKTDRSDASGLLEAHRNEAIRPVPVKSVDQHALTGLHRMRSTWVATRTARLNTIRGLLRELGLTIPARARWCPASGSSSRSQPRRSPARCAPCSPRRHGKWRSSSGASRRSRPNSKASRDRAR